MVFCYMMNAFFNKSSSWDEWVPENRVLKYNEANVQRQKEVSKVHTSGSAKSKKGAVVGTGEIGIFQSITTMIKITYSTFSFNIKTEKTGQYQFKW